MDRGALWATAHGIAKSWTQLKQLSTHQPSLTKSTGPEIPQTNSENQLIPISTLNNWILNFTLGLLFRKDLHRVLILCQFVFSQSGTHLISLHLNDGFPSFSGLASRVCNPCSQLDRDPHSASLVFSLMFCCGYLEILNNFIFELVFCR